VNLSVRTAARYTWEPMLAGGDEDEDGLLSSLLPRGCRWPKRRRCRRLSVWCGAQP